MTLTDFYNTAVKPLSLVDRLRLARMILDDLPPQTLADYKDEWTDEDLREFSAHNWKAAPPFEGDIDDDKGG